VEESLHELLGYASPCRANDTWLAIDDCDEARKQRVEFAITRDEVPPACRLAGRRQSILALLGTNDVQRLQLLSSHVRPRTSGTATLLTENLPVP